MHTYYCPNCGKALRQSECKIEKRFGLISKISCPQCDVGAQHSGGILFIAGLLIAIVGGFIMPLEMVALVVGAGFCFVGLMRLVRQFRVSRTYVATYEKS